LLIFQRQYYTNVDVNIILDFSLTNKNYKNNEKRESTHANVQSYPSNEKRELSVSKNGPPCSKTTELSFFGP